MPTSGRTTTTDLPHRSRAVLITRHKVSEELRIHIGSRAAISTFGSCECRSDEHIGLTEALDSSQNSDVASRRHLNELLKAASKQKTSKKTPKQEYEEALNNPILTAVPHADCKECQKAKYWSKDSYYGCPLHCNECPLSVTRGKWERRFGKDLIVASHPSQLCNAHEVDRIRRKKEILKEREEYRK